MTTLSLGIDDISAATASLMLPLEALADAQGIDAGKYLRGIGQEEMSIPSADEDVVTLAARAAQPIIERHGAQDIRTVFFATETGIDQSKAAGIYVHDLLGLSPHTRVVEMKEACYAGTAALQAALGIVARRPEEKVLVIASDIARYELDSSGEATQGAGAVAFLVTANPRILEIEPASGLFTDNVHDFWRPNDRTTALVDGRFSVQVYLRAVIDAWEDYRAQGGAEFADIARICFHQPFTKMAAKALKALARHADSGAEAAAVDGLEETMILNRRVGNSYTASAYIGFLSLLEKGSLEAGERVGFFSFGSGAVAEFFTGTLVKGYRDCVRLGALEEQLEARRPIDYAEYRERHIGAERTGDYENPAETTGVFRFVGVKDSVRLYERREAQDVKTYTSDDSGFADALTKG